MLPLEKAEIGMDNPELIQIRIFLRERLSVVHVGGFYLFNLRAEFARFRKRPFVIPQIYGGVFMLYDFALMFFAEPLFEKLGFLVLFIDWFRAVVDDNIVAPIFERRYPFFVCFYPVGNGFDIGAAG